MLSLGSVRSRRSVVLAACVAASIGFAAAPAAASDDHVAITVTLPFPGGFGPDDGVTYRLAGQSAFYSTRTNGVTTGGQLDGLSSSGSPHLIEYTEVFPEASLADYLRYGYFGVLETVVDDGTGERVIDRSFVIAGRFGAFDGLAIDSILPFFQESELVDALVNGFDTPEFFDALSAALGNADLLGDMTLLSRPDLNGPVDTVRAGEMLGLYALIGGVPGEEDRAVLIGDLSASVLRVVPSPGALALASLAGFVATRRRRA
ncbi:MAG: hypothetical protein HRU70_09900 [Phycisphaeraceae bacterium]|nr:MAG: hypothetical protein HRU70_09900 [Phycisphaeraceae bacterium]